MKESLLIFRRAVRHIDVREMEKTNSGMRGTRMDCLATNTMEFPLPQIFKKEPDKHLSVRKYVVDPASR